MTSTTAYQPNAVRAWLRILHGDSPGLVSIVSTDDWAGRAFTDLDLAAAYISQLDAAGREGIYCRVTTITAPPAPGKRAGAADSASLPALWADLDLAGPGHVEQDLPPNEAAGRAVIAAAGLPDPTIWVHSGGGLYPIWLLDTPHLITADNLDAAKQLTKQWQAVIEHGAASLGWRYGRGVGDLARVLRIPGTVNRKEGLARPCRIITANATRYTHQQLVDALDAAVTRITPQVVAPTAPVIGAPTPVTPRTDPNGITPGDDYAARTGWAQILEPAGWSEHYQQDDVTYWTRPGKTTGTSASTNALGTDRLHVFSTSAAPLDGGESYSKLGAYAALAYGGDHHAAVKALAAAGYGTPLPDPGIAHREALADILGGPVPDPPLAPAGTTVSGRGVIARTWDDIGNADRLIDRYDGMLRWAVDAEKWLVYTGTHWAVEGAPTYILGLVRDMLDDLTGTEAYQYDDTPRVDENGKQKPSEREEFFRFVKRQRVQTRMTAATVVATAAKSVHASMKDFDADPYLLNCPNGALNLQNGELLPHDSSMMFASVAGCAYDRDAAAPRWMRFLDTVMPDPEVRAYLARIAGYTLTGATGEQVLFLHHGSGANGKSVFMQVLRALMGTYGQSIPQGTLLAKTGGISSGVPNDVARMIGKRLLITSETGAGRRLDDELVKQLTGGEAVSARFMRGEFFDFTPVGKIHIMTNHLPNVGGGDGIARRLQDIGWDVTIPPEKRDRLLAARIIAEELPGVLAWASAGCREWLDVGLDTPEAVRRKTAKHVFEADPIAQWLEERVEESAGCETETREMYLDYRGWTETGGARPMTEKAFTQVIDERGWDRGKSPSTRRSVIFGRRLYPRQVGEGLISGMRVA